MDGHHGLVEEALGHWREIFGLAFTLTGDAARSEDHCQEAIVRLASMKREVDRSRSLRSLLLRIVRNLVIDDGRAPSADLLEEESLPSVQPESDPLREAVRREEIDAVQGALAELPVSWRSILYLRDALDFSYREIASVEGCSKDVVRVTLHRARRRIRSVLERTNKGARP